jgi:hypothetical protein
VYLSIILYLFLQAEFSFASLSTAAALEAARAAIAAALAAVVLYALFSFAPPQHHLLGDRKETVMFEHAVSFFVCLEMAFLLGFAGFWWFGLDESASSVT